MISWNYRTSGSSHPLATDPTVNDVSVYAAKYNDHQICDWICKSCPNSHNGRLSVCSQLLPKELPELQRNLPSKYMMVWNLSFCLCVQGHASCTIQMLIILSSSDCIFNQMMVIGGISDFCLKLLSLATIILCLLK